MLFRHLVASSRRARRNQKTITLRQLQFEGLETRAMLTASGDFNGDGIDDLAISAAGYDVGGQTNAGAVHVLYGGDQGLSADGNQWWTLDSPGVNGRAQAGDGFGTVVAVGDFNHDGFDDLAIGAPGKTVSGYSQAGAVTVLYGSRNGLTAAGDQFWTQDSQSINGRALNGDHFGAALAAGDFDGDGYDDLAIGTPGENVAGNADAGGVNVIFGSRHRLSRAHDQLLYHVNVNSSVTNPGTISKFFGSTLAAGDFDGDGYDDLVASMKEATSAHDKQPLSGSTITISPVTVGPLLPGIFLPGQSPPVKNIVIDGSNLPAFKPVAGAVDVIYGSADGLSTTDAKNLPPRAMYGRSLDPAANDFFFGMSLAVGDFNGDGFDDLVIGSPGEKTVHPAVVTASYPPHVIPETTEYGSVHLMNGGSNGLLQSKNVLPSDFGQPLETESGFGLSLAAGDFNRDGIDDLAVGSPLADVNGQSAAGLVGVIYGGVTPQTKWAASTKGLIGKTEVWQQDIGSMLDIAEAGDEYGAQLFAGDYNGDGRADLGASVPNENGSGAVSIIYAKRDGLADNNNQLWTPDFAEPGGTSQPGTTYGAVLHATTGYGAITVNVGAFNLNQGNTITMQTLSTDFISSGTVTQNGLFGYAGNTAIVGNGLLENKSA